MKRVIFVFTGLLAYHLGISQNTYPWPQTGPIGIGTTSPNGKLGIGNQTDLVQTNGITLGLGDASIEFIESTYALGFGFKLYTDYYGVGGQVNFELASRNGSTAWSDLLTVQSNTGNFGIGVSDPLYKLDVGSTIRAKNYQLLTGVDATGEGIKADDATGSTVFSLTRNSGNEIRLQGYGPLTFFTNGSIGTEKMRITNDGKVGIGSSLPLSMLDVNGNMNLGSSYHLSSRVESLGLALGVDQKSIEFVHSNYGAGYGAKIYGVDEGGGVTSLRIAARGGNTIWKDAIYIKASNSGSNGFIGIGTNSPDEALTVKGSIHSEEVRVEVVNGSDFVFEPDYNLPTLEATEAYIKAHKHLPEIPSAAEMQANGLELGKMNMLLLQKIEELTLYIIEQQKQIAEQNIKIAKQNQRITEFIETKEP